MDVSRPKYMAQRRVHSKLHGLETINRTKTLVSRAEEFGQNYVRSAATSVDKSEKSPQFSYIICVECVEFEDKNSTHSTQNYVRKLR